MESLNPLESLENKNNQTLGSFKIFGYTSLIIGFILILLPSIGTLAIEFILGTFFLFIGIAQFVHGIVSKNKHTDTLRGVFLDLIMGLIYILAGVFLLLNPFQGAVILTFLVGIILITESVLSATIAFYNNAIFPTSWAILNSFTSFLLGLIILFGLPETALWTLGIIVGINSMITGFFALKVSSFKAVGN